MYCRCTAMVIPTLYIPYKLDIVHLSYSCMMVEALRIQPAKLYRQFVDTATSCMPLLQHADASRWQPFRIDKAESCMAVVRKLLT